MSLKTVCVPVASFSALQLVSVAVWLAFCSGCVSRSESDVVVYSALDEDFAAPILAAFERSTENEVGVIGKYDIESTKTVGLANQLIAEADAPRCDLFWNNEIMHTVRLQKLGILEPHGWRVPSTWPQDMVASDGTWCGFAARARVLLINTDLLPSIDERPTRVNELADPKWEQNCAMARPLFGTTATHFAVLRDIIGKEKTLELLQSIHENAVVLSGNKQVAQAVSSGKVAWGLTDTDDAIIEKDLGYPVEIIYPDQQPEQPGTLRIPNTLAILKNAPHPRWGEAVSCRSAKRASSLPRFCQVNRCVGCELTLRLQRKTGTLGRKPWRICSRTDPICLLFRRGRTTIGLVIDRVVVASESAGTLGSYGSHVRTFIG